jgi:hypothetical protein
MMKNLNSFEKRLALSAGDHVKPAGDGQPLTRTPAKPNPFAKYKGSLKHFRSRKEINAWVREMRGHTKDSD